MKKLQLSRETVRILSDQDLRLAQGARVVPGEMSNPCDSENNCDPTITSAVSCYETCYQYYSCLAC